jgi:trans-aconitate methyltransferase
MTEPQDLHRSPQDHQHGHKHGHGEHHGHGESHRHPDDEAAIAQLNLEGEVFASYLTMALDLAQELGSAQRVDRTIDVGCGPGVGTMQLARRFPDATVVALDASAPMLSAVRKRADAEGFGHRLLTHQAELPHGTDGLGPADLIWASMSLHHVGDEVAAIRSIGRELAEDGVLIIAEMAAHLQVRLSPEHAATTELLARVDRAWDTWFASMRSSLPGHRASGRFADMVGEAGLTVVSATTRSMSHPGPVGSPAHALAIRRLQGALSRLGDELSAGDRVALGALVDPGRDDSLHSQDLVLESARLLVLAQPC